MWCCGGLKRPMRARRCREHGGRQKAVHGDVQALLLAGVLDRTERGVVFAYDAIHVDFTLTKAA